MSLLGELSRELSALAARAAPAVVGLEQGRGQASGLVLSPDGYVLTNAHAVGRAGRVRVRLWGRDAADGEVVGVDERTDLAVVRTEARGLEALSLEEERALEVGQLVVAIGNPLGFERSVSLGVVSALFRNLPTRTGGLEGLIQTDAAVNPGNSGGPLLDVAGRVVGITSAMIAYARGIGFAIPARTASWVATVLIRDGRVRRPYVGITARSEELAPVVSQAARQGRAVRVLGVEAGAPAETAGLRSEDLLLAANDSAVTTVDDLQRVLVLATSPEVQLQLLRGGERRQVTLRARPDARAA